MMNYYWKSNFIHGCSTRPNMERAGAHKQSELAWDPSEGRIGVEPNPGSFILVRTQSVVVLVDGWLLL